ncbi:MAG: hypothetical protein PUF97_03285 [Bifidobacteriaceae bacterium]|nr:hypothetical protein [Bifidobacteriaceae bacterium]
MPTRAMTVLRFVVFYPIAFLVTSWVTLGWNRVNAWLHRWRWAIGAVTVAWCTLLNLNGSSVGSWFVYTFVQDKPYMGNVLFGAPRLERTDESMDNTPFAFSQEYSGYSLHNNLLGSIDSTNMFLVKDSPTFSVGEIFHPFHWGYLLFGSERGLAFYWTARLVVLFLVAYEFFRAITRPRGARTTSGEHRGLAVIGAALVTFSPIVQWWYAVNNIVELLIVLFAAPLLFDRYLSSHSTAGRLGYALAIAECAGMFVWALYPALQVPCAYLMLVLLVWVLTQHWGGIRMTVRDWLVAAGVCVVFACFMAVALYQSRDAIVAIMHTTYPGHRRSLGGDCPWAMLMDGVATAALISNTDLSIVNPEMAAVLDFLPLVLITAIAGMVHAKRHGKKIDGLTVALMVANLFGYWYMILGFPKWLATASMLSYSLTRRVLVFVGIANIVILIRNIALKEWKLPTGASAVCTVVGGVVFGVASSMALRSCIEARYTTPDDGLIVLACVLSIVQYIAMTWLCLATTGTCAQDEQSVDGEPVSRAADPAVSAVVTAPARRRVPSAVTALAMLCVVTVVGATGMGVNPVEVGAYGLTDLPIVTVAKGVYLQNPHPFVTISDDHIWASGIATALAGNGIPALNTNQIEPHMTLWNSLDPEHVQEDVWNRQAAILVNVVSEQEEPQDAITLVSMREVGVNLTVKQLHDLGVGYAVSYDDLSQYPAGGYAFQRVASAPAGGLSIWQIVEAG